MTVSVDATPVHLIKISDFADLSDRQKWRLSLELIYCYIILRTNVIEFETMRRLMSCFDFNPEEEIYQHSIFLRKSLEITKPILKIFYKSKTLIS